MISTKRKSVLVKARTSAMNPFKSVTILSSSLSSFGARLRASPQPNRERIRQKENYPIPA